MTRLRQAKEIDQFVADQAGIERKEDRQKQPRAESIEESCLCQEDKDEYPEGSHRKLGTRKGRRPLCHDRIHERVGFNHAHVEELEGQERISTGQEHRPRRKEEQPWMMPVEKYNFGVIFTPVRVAPGKGKSVDNGPP